MYCTSLKTSLWLVIRQDTCWSSSFAMVNRHFDLLPFIDANDDDLADFLPTAACNRQLRELLIELKDYESVSKALQGDGVSLLDARVWFDGLIASYPPFKDFLDTRSAGSYCVE
jgi:hypothetical protein